MVRVSVELVGRSWRVMPNPGPINEPLPPRGEQIAELEVPHEGSDCHDQLVSALRGRVLLAGDVVHLRELADGDENTVAPPFDPPFPERDTDADFASGIVGGVGAGAAVPVICSPLDPLKGDEEANDEVMGTVAR